MRDGLCDADVYSLRELALRSSKEGVIFIEVGSWKGHSSAVLGQIAKEYKGHLYCVDHWKGSPGVEHHSYEGNVFQTFFNNMMVFGLAKYVHPLVMDSLAASRIFADGIADLVFIDANHYYTSVKQDIASWLPKVKTGGLLCGHDCEGYYLEYNENGRAAIDRGLEQDVQCPPGCHAGVVKALYDCFGSDFNIAKRAIPREEREVSSIWFKEKNA